MPKKKSKKSKEPKITYYEALLGYKISLKEKELEDANFALKDLAEKNENYNQRNDRLKETREFYLRKAIKDYKNLNDETDKQEKCVKEDVLKEMKNLWNFQKQLDDELIDLRIQIKQKENSISQTKKDIKMWNEFNAKGKHEIQTQIKLLKQEVDDMKFNFDIMSKYFASELEYTRVFITKDTDETVAKEHKQAAQKIFKEMDKYTVQMMHDNKWMEEKIKLYEEETRKLNEETSKLEKENIESMTKLFECSVADLKVIKDAFQFQFLDNDNVEENAILDIDLDKLDTIRPKSGLDKAIDRVRKVRISEPKDDVKEDDDGNEETFLTQAPEEFSSYLNLGPYEYKSLTLKGFKKPIYRPKTPNSEEIIAFNFNLNEWPVTKDMLTEKLDN